MLRTKQLAVLAMLGISLMACSKSDLSPTNLVQAFTNSMACKIDGTAFSSVTTTGKLVTPSIIITGTGSVTGFPIMSVYVAKKATTGAHDLDALGLSEGYAVSYSKSTAAADNYTTAQTLSNSVFSTAGSINIISIDTVKATVSGSFTATVSNSSKGTVAISEGTFSGSYSK